MTRAIQLKQARAVVVGEQILKAHSSGILLAHKIDTVLALDDGKWIEIGTDSISHILSGNDVVAVVE